MTSSPSRALVSGAAGFIGSHVTRRLVQDGVHVLALVRPGSDLTRLADLLPDLELVERDVRTLEPDLAASVRPLDVVYHLAAAGVVAGSADAWELLDVNATGTLHLLELAAAAEAARFVHCGSCFEYGTGTRLGEDAPLRPVAPYGASKAAGTLLALAFGRSRRLPVLALRPFTAYGPGEPAGRLAPTVLSRALAGETIEVTGGEQTRDFVYVQDVADAFAIAGEATVEGEVLNLCSGTETSVAAFVRDALAIVGSGEALFGAVPYREDEVWSLSGDPSRAAAKLGWLARTPLLDGIAKTLEALEPRSGVTG